jgi:hypothetical protein
MKRIAIITTITAAAVIFGVIEPTSAETTVPMEDLALVSETSAATTPVSEEIQPEAAPRFQFGRFQRPRFQFGRFQGGRFQGGRFQRPRFQFGRFQGGRFQGGRFQGGRFQFPRHR